MTFKVKEGISIAGENFVNNNRNITATTVALDGQIASSNDTTGTLVVDGGVGVTGDLNVGGAFGIGVDLSIAGDATIGGDLTVNGTITTINSTTVTVDDKNLELGSVDTPTDTTADGGGITLKGATDKTLNWVNATDSWTSSEHFDLATGKGYRIDATEILNSTQLFPSQTSVDIAPSASVIIGANNSGTLTLRNAQVNINQDLDVGGSANITGNFSVATDSFSVNASSGNTISYGTMYAVGSITTNNSFVSLVANGTAPLTVSSSTKVENLNVDFLDGFSASVSNTNDTVVVRDSTGDINVSNVVLSGATSGTVTIQAESTASGTVTIPNATDTLIGKNTTDTLTNKTINFVNNTVTGTTAEFNSALSDNDFATIAGTEILTNKTLTDPTVNAQSGTLILPSSTTPSQTAEGSIVWDTDSDLLTLGTGTGRKTVVDTDSSQTLTNKTLSNPTITGISPQITLGGDLSGSVTLTDLGNGTLNATINANAVALGTDTTGDYVATIAGTPNRITVTRSGSENAGVTLNLPQDIHTGANPLFAGGTFDNIRIGVTSGNEIDTTSGNLTIDSAGGTVTVDDNLIVSGDLTVNGTVTTVNSTTVTVDDKNIELGSIASPTDTTADGGGITLKGATDKTLNWVNATDSWTSSENIELASGKSYRINGNTVLTSNTLGSQVVNSSLTSVGTINSGTWQAGIISSTYGGTGVNNEGRTITVAGNFETVGANSLTLTTTGPTNVTLPTSGTLSTVDGDLEQFAPTTSAQLANVISDETGTGSLVFSNSPTLTTPSLGDASVTTINDIQIFGNTGAFIEFTNPGDQLIIDGSELQMQGATASFGSGGTVAFTEDNLSVFGATTSSQLAGIISDETGTGSLVFANSPTLTTPTISEIRGSTTASGTLTLRGTSNATKGTVGVNVVDTIVSTSTTTGALVVDGGVGIGENLNVNGDISLNGSLSLNDNEKITLGASNDLEIYHTGSNSFIDDSGTGNLQIRSNALYLQKYTGENYLRALEDGAVNIYFNNSSKLTTTSTGISVTGDVNTDTVTTSGNATVSGNLSVTGTTDLGNLTSDLLPNTDNTGVVGNATNTWSNGHFTNFTVDSTLNVRGAIDLSDSDVLRFGSSDDVKMFYNGSTNVFDIELEAATSTLRITDNGTERFSIAKGTGNTNVGGSLTVTGDLVVNGTTTTVNSSNVTLDDPIFTLGGDTAPTSDDNKDRGIEFRYFDGSAKVGFFGFDDSTGKFTFIPDATNTTEVFSGSKGVIDANIEWTDVLNKPDPQITVTLTGDVTGTGNATLTDLANGTISFGTTIQPDSVALGTDTTGDYVQTITQGTGISVTNGTGEGSTPTIAHADTSSVTDLTSNNSGSTFIQDISFEFDEFGHVTAASVATGNALTSQANDFGTVTVSDIDNGFTWFGTGSATADSVSDTVTFVSGTGINVDVDATNDAIRFTNSDTGSAQNIFKTITIKEDGTSQGNIAASSNSDSFTVNAQGGITAALSGNEIQLLHSDTSSQTSVNNSLGTVIQDVTLDGYGHVTGLTSYNLDNRYYTETESDGRFLQLSGGSLTGALDFTGTTGRVITITNDTTLDAADASIYLGNSTASYGFDITYEGTGSGNTNALVITSTNSGSSNEVLRSNQDGILQIAQLGATIDGNTVWHAGNFNAFGTVTVSGQNNIVADGGSDTLNIAAGTGISLTTNASTDTLTIAHGDTSSVNAVTSNNSGNTFIQDISLTFDTYGHVTGASVATGSVSGFSTTDFSTITVTDTDTGFSWSQTGSAVADQISDTVTFVSGTGVDIDVDATNDAIRFENTDRGSSQNIFKNVAVSGQNTVTADSNNDTLTLVAGANVTITTDSATDSITIAATPDGGGGDDNLQAVTDVGSTTTNAIEITNSTASTSTTTGALIVSGGVGIGGALNATTKSFIIDHPTKDDMLLKHGSLEGPEFGVYVRGRLKGNGIIELPDYWRELVDEDTITVDVTPVGKYQKLYVEDIKDNKVYVGNDNLFKKEINCFYTVWAERKDVDKLVVEDKK